ncbi:MAG: hypothetical protein A2Y67_03450 [Candidatus Buchananbacteria bacterium RBG_13_39_9]|uniref:PPM-type phosphatase domain-containing protein n=1 Tax=Candidatus Buchananbacteria bacterium RBG_13_39_9 TaxID=1797531 RepID=A0A1G1XS47_9BACT|nr:MAG: hypothetical protein A2Y67_03450 [Candidatus Buchananbacteria bacterium RBG_13_39_9]
MNQIVNQFAHIFIHYYSNKTASSCKLFISEPTQNQERLLGCLFGILEINTPSRENAPLINLLINELEETYYSKAENENIKLEECFENTLKEVNSKFHQLIKERQITLVGNLNENTIKEKINLGIGVIKDNQLYLSYLNNINIFLIHRTKQDFKIIDIKKIASNENSEGQETSNLFANLLSGEVNPPDFLFLANGNFLDFISTERIQKIISSLPLHKAAEYFKNSLLQHEGNNFAAIIIKSSHGDTQTDKEPASLTSITELNYTESITEKLLTPSFWNILKNLPHKLFVFFSRFKRRQKQPVKETLEQTVSGEIPTEISQVKPRGIWQSIWGFISNIFIKIYKGLKNFIANNQFLTARINNLKLKLHIKITLLKNFFKKIPNLSKILFFIAIIMIILFIYSIYYLKHQQKSTINQKEYQELTGKIEELKNQAESDLIYGDEAKARDEISEAQKLLATLPLESKKQKETNENLNNSLQTIIAKLRHITIISDPTLIADLSTLEENNIDIQNMVLDKNNIDVFNSFNNSNFVINLETRETKKYMTNLTDIGVIIRARSIDNKILLYHDKNAFIQYQDNKYSPYSVATPANGHLIDFVFYNARLYSLDLTSNQIYRQPQADTGFGPGVTWLKSSEDFKDIVAMSIDTNIWLLDKTGKILKFTKGRKQNFETTNLEPILEEPTKLFTSDGTKYLYILEPKNKRIVVLDKNGQLVIQYFSETFNNLRDFIIIEKEKKIFVANENKIYFFNLSHL